MLLFLACAGEGAPELDGGTCDASGPTRAGVLSEILFARADEAGVSEGFDLDGEQTDAGDSSGCGVADYTDPRGVEGIDNGFAILVPALELTEAAAVEGLIQSAIQSGELLLLYEIEGLDDPVNDDCVGFSLWRGDGAPSLGTDGTLEWSQTFDRAEQEPSRVDGLPVVDGVVVASGLEIALPVTVLGVDLLFELHDASVRVELHDDGSATGVFGGGTSVGAILTVAQTENVDPDLVGVLEGLFGLASDLTPNAEGGCDDIAVNFEFSAAPAFFFDE